mgnify:CR=1 FL=1
MEEYKKSFNPDSYRDWKTQEVEEVLKKENVEFPAGRIESRDIDLTIKLDKAYKNLEKIQ